MQSPWDDLIARHDAALTAAGPLRVLSADVVCPAERACEMQLRWLLAFGDDAAHPSPWAPLLAIFERGAWPIVLGDATVLVYVPVLRDGAIVPTPDAPGEALLPARVPQPASTSSSLPALEAQGMSVPPMAPRTYQPTGRGGRVMVVGPNPVRAGVPVNSTPPRRAPQAEPERLVRRGTRPRRDDA